MLCWWWRTIEREIYLDILLSVELLGDFFRENVVQFLRQQKLGGM